MGDAPLTAVIVPAAGRGERLGPGAPKALRTLAGQPILLHAVRNLATALAVEAAELLEPFQWLGEGDSPALPPATRAAVEEEMADVLLYLVRLADKLDVDLIDAARTKMTHNAAKYPVEKSRGSSRKYDEL